MDFETGLENFEGIDHACLAKDWVINIPGRDPHLCSSFSNEDLPSVYLGYVAFKTGWGIRTIMGKFVTGDVDKYTEGTNDFPLSIAQKFSEARNSCYTPRLLNAITGQFSNVPWPSGITSSPSIGPGTYWGRSLYEIIPISPAPTPPQSP